METKNRGVALTDHKSSKYPKLSIRNGKRFGRIRIKRPEILFISDSIVRRQLITPDRPTEGALKGNF